MARLLVSERWRGRGVCVTYPAGSVLAELDVLDVLTAARTIQGETVADDLDDLGAHKLGELVGRLAAGEQAAILDGALDELVGVERLLGLLGDGVGHVGLADMDDGVEVVREGAELADLLAGESHVFARFLRR